VTEALNLWSKVDFSLVPDAPPESQDEPEHSWAERMRSYWRWRRPLLDVIGILLWVYAILKVFIVDLDSELLGGAARYRFFAFLALAAVLAIVLRKRSGILAGFLYIAAFPAVIACWKLPKLLGKARTPVAFMAAANALTLLFTDVKRSLLASTLATFCTLAIAVSHWTPLLVLAAALLAALILRTTYRTVRLSLNPSTFLRAQQKAIRTVVNSKAVRGFTAPAEELRRPEIKRFTTQQQEQFITNLANSVLSHRILTYWAYQLERYRRSPASLGFNSVSYLWLVVRVVLGLSLLNLALYHADASSFTFTHGPTFLVFVRFVIAGLYGAEIGALQPENDWANALSVATFVAGLLVAGSLVVSSALAFRASREESDIRETVVEIQRESAQLDLQLRENYEVSVPEAIERLEQLKYALPGLIRFISTRIPADFEKA
jgi:hypothetical protein